jgi:phage shock protein A
MLDRAEDPEKMIKLMIREMEDTLIEIKAACAGVMAGSKKVQRQLDEIDTRSQYWEEKAALAVKKGRDDLAKEALVEKRRFIMRKSALENELHELHLLVEGYQENIQQLEEKLKSAREKKRLLVQRHIHARKKKRAQEEIRRLESSEVMFKFDDLESRIERMESEADLVNYGKKSDLEDQLDKLCVDDEIEAELQALKRPGPGQDKIDSKAESQ